MSLAIKYQSRFIQFFLLLTFRHGRFDVEEVRDREVELPEGFRQEQRQAEVQTSDRG